MHWNGGCDVGWLLGRLLVWADNYVNKTIRRVLVDRGPTDVGGLGEMFVRCRGRGEVEGGSQMEVGGPGEPRAR